MCLAVKPHDCTVLSVLNLPDQIKYAVPGHACHWPPATMLWKMIVTGGICTLIGFESLISLQASQHTELALYHN